MRDKTKDICPLTDFQQNTQEFLRQLKETRRPVALTVNGKSELVIQDAESYQALLDAVERAETIAGLRRGLDQMNRGEGRPAEALFAEMKLKNRLPDE